MKTGFSSNFGHKDDFCTDMAEKQKGFQKGSKRHSGQDPKMFGLIYKSKRAVYGSAMLEKNMAEQNIAIRKHQYVPTFFGLKQRYNLPFNFCKCFYFNLVC